MLTRAISGDDDTSSHIVPEEVSIALFAIYNETWLLIRSSSIEAQTT